MAIWASDWPRRRAMRFRALTRARFSLLNMAVDIDLSWLARLPAGMPFR